MKLRFIMWKWRGVPMLYCIYILHHTTLYSYSNKRNRKWKLPRAIEDKSSISRSKERNIGLFWLAQTSQRSKPLKHNQLQSCTMMSTNDEETKTSINSMGYRVDNSYDGLRQNYQDAMECIIHCEKIIKALEGQLASKDDHIAWLKAALCLLITDKWTNMCSL